MVCNFIRESLSQTRLILVFSLEILNNDNEGDENVEDHERINNLQQGRIVRDMIIQNYFRNVEEVNNN